MSILLDTNALVWLLDNSDLFGANAKNLIESSDAVYASSVNIAELRIKSMLGQIEIPETLLEDINSAGLKMLPFQADHAEALKDFPRLRNYDLFDRMLLAQSKVSNMQLMTSDKFLQDLDLGFVISSNR